jgi:hypothetical protein
MARKTRQVLPQVTGAAPKETIRYQDKFQRVSEKRVEELSKKVEGKGKTILYALGALAVLAVLVGIFVLWNRRTTAQAQAALGKAIETSQAQVSASPPAAGSAADKTFKTERERAEASANEFQDVAGKYSVVRDKANYFAAVNRLSLDRDAAEQQLGDLGKTSGEVGFLSKFALAQAKAGDGKVDEAAALYQELAQSSQTIVPKDSVNFELAKLYEKQGKKDDAVNLYYNIAKGASEAKDADGKAIPLSQTASAAKNKLKTLDPAKAAEIKEATPDFSGGFPGGL